MERPTDNLRADHILMARGLGALRSVAAHVREGGVFPVDDTALLLRFLREFVLAVHVHKENELVCPAVAMRADDTAAALVGEIMRVHEEVAELAHCLVLFWEPVGELTAAERTGFAETVEALIGRLLRLQELEEDELFPVCDRAVPADDQLEWIARFAQLERERGSRSEWHDRVVALAARWPA